MHIQRSTLVAVAAGAVASLGIGGIAVLLGSGALAAGGQSLADSTPSTGPSASSRPNPSSTPGTGQDGRRHRGYGDGLGRGPGHLGMGWGMGRGMLGGGFLHGEIVVNKSDGSGTETLLVQQGEITAKGSDSVTVKSTDGYTVRWSVSSSTRIWAPGTKLDKPANPPATPPSTGSLADLTVGASVNVVGSKTADGGAARLIAGKPTWAAGQGQGQDQRSQDRRGTPSPAPSATGAAYLGA